MGDTFIYWHCVSAFEGQFSFITHQVTMSPLNKTRVPHVSLPRNQVIYTAATNLGDAEASERAWRDDRRETCSHSSACLL